MTYKIYIGAGCTPGIIDTPDETYFVELFYPRSKGNVKAVEVGLMDVRAADSLRIEYDFDRDGYSIKQASKFSWDASDKVCDPDWQEVAFVRAWARQGDE